MEVCVSKSIGLAYSWKEIYVGNLQKGFSETRLEKVDLSKTQPSTIPRSGYAWKGHLMDGFLRYEFWGLSFRVAYTWRGYFQNFRVFSRHCNLVANCYFG